MENAQGNKGQHRSTNQMREAAARRALGFGRWMTIPTAGLVKCRMRFEGFRLIASGVLAGVALAIILSRVLRTFLFDVQPESSAGAATTATNAGIPLTEQQLAGLVGLYWDSDGDQFWNVYLKDGKPRVSLGREDDFVLKPVSGTFFHLAEVPFGDEVNLHFQPGAGDKPRRLLESFGDGKPSVFESVTPFTPSVAERAEYAGNYVSDEIDPVYRMIVQDGNLVLTRLKHKPDSLEPRTRDVFSGKIGTIRFTRDSNHRVSGFLLSTGRIRNFRFTRRAN